MCNMFISLYSLFQIKRSRLYFQTIIKGAVLLYQIINRKLAKNVFFLACYSFNLTTPCMVIYSKESFQKLHNWKIITLHTLTFVDDLVFQRTVSTSRKLLFFFLFECLELGSVPFSVLDTRLYTLVISFYLHI